MDSRLAIAQGLVEIIRERWPNIWVDFDDDEHSQQNRLAQLVTGKPVSALERIINLRCWARIKIILYPDNCIISSYQFKMPSLQFEYANPDFMDQVLAAIQTRLDSVSRRGKVLKRT